MLVAIIDKKISNTCGHVRSFVKERLKDERIGGKLSITKVLFLCFILLLVSIGYFSISKTEDDMVYERGGSKLRGSGAGTVFGDASWENQPLKAVRKAKPEQGTTEGTQLNKGKIKEVLKTIDQKALDALQKKEVRIAAAAAEKEAESKKADINTGEDTTNEQKKQPPLNEEDLVNEVLQENPPEVQGERAEWKQKTGVHRKENIF